MGLDLRPLAAIPQQIVELLARGRRPRARAARDGELDRVQRDARISTSSGEPAGSSSPRSIRASRSGVVDQHALAAQHVRHEVVGEDRELVEVAERAGPAPAERGREIAAVICARL
jgi:hypothetical protein